MFEDMIKANVKANSREMAGRFLYSNGYQELVNYLKTKA
jgi:hypothetical protein